MVSVDELETAFQVYFDEIERCRTSGTYWALLHVLVSLPDICAGLESESGWATAAKYVAWCECYCPLDGLTAEGYREIRDKVLHEGRTLTESGRLYRFTRPEASGDRFHRRLAADGVMVVDVDELATEVAASVRKWFADLQGEAAASRRVNVARHLPSLVMAQNQELPGSGGVTYAVTHTCTPMSRVIRAM